MKFSWRRMGYLPVFFLATMATPAFAQGQGQPPPDQLPETAVGKVGERQSGEQAQAYVAPMGRIDSRVANRILNRIQSRIDRYYNPRANTTSPFEVAADRARKAGVQEPR